MPWSLLSDTTYKKDASKTGPVGAMVPTRGDARLMESIPRYVAFSCIALYAVAGALMLVAMPVTSCALGTIDCNRRFLSLSRLSHTDVPQTIFAVGTIAFASATLIVSQMANSTFPDLVPRILFIALSSTGPLFLIVFVCSPVQMTMAERVSDANMRHMVSTIAGFGFPQLWVVAFAFASHLARRPKTLGKITQRRWRLACALRWVVAVNLLMSLAIVLCYNTNECFLASEVLYTVLLVVQHGLVIALLFAGDPL